MTETVDQLIQARFEAVANPLDDGDWGDVLARARRREPVRRVRAGSIRLALAATVAVLAVTVTAVAFGWPGAVVDFFAAPPAPENVSAFFARFHLAAPGGISPRTNLGQARRIMSATFDADHLPPRHPTLHTLYVAPKADGGFCYLWTGYGGSCADVENATAGKTAPGARPLGLDWLEHDYVGVVDGWVRPDVRTIEARFADGTTASIPVTWVSAPIDAGFFAYVVPPAHLTRADALASVVALDGNGGVVGRQAFALTEPLDQDVLQTLPDGTKRSLPRRAQAARARKIVDFRAADGSHVYLWVMPRTGGGVCFLYGTGAGGGGGCPSRYWLRHLPAVDGGVLKAVYFAEVRPDIATIELRFRNGGSERLTPTDGFVLHQVGPGARLAAVVGLDRSGRAVFRQHYPPRAVRQQGPG